MTAEESIQTETTAQKKVRLAEEKKEKEAAIAKAAELEKQKQETEKKAELAKSKKDAKTALKLAAEAQAQAATANANLKKLEKEVKEAEKAKKNLTLKDLVDDYNLKEIGGVWVPGYFHRKKRYADNAEQQVDVYHAKNFLLGMEIFAEQGSCSAKFTYIGPNRRYTLNNVRIGKREPRPTQNNWKIFSAPVRMLRKTEHNSKVKDPKIIRDVLTSQGGKANFEVRFVQDKEFTQAEIKKKVFHKDPVRLKQLNYRIKKDQAKLGVKPVLRNKAEALLLQKDIKKEVKDKRAHHVLKYLQTEIEKYNVIEKKLKLEESKD